MLKILRHFLAFLFFLNAIPSFGYDLVVAKDGSGDYTTVQAAINAAPTGAVSAFTIFIKNGEYVEKITVPSNKPFITLEGESTDGVILTYNDYASKPLDGGGTVGTLNSASVTINAPDFIALNITFVNSYGDGSQAVAVAVNSDRVVFKNCRFLGNQDTLYVRGSGTPRQYFNNCYIDGNVDYIFGNAVAVFDSCAIFSKARVGTGNSYLTAPNTPAGQAYGFVFRNCLLTDHNGSTLYYLGRPWQNSTGSSPLANNKSIFLNCRMGNKIRNDGWSTWDAGTQTNLITFAEYKTMWFGGDLVNTGQRVAWSKQLNDAEAADYTLANIFGGWNPCNLLAGICSTLAFRPSVNNFSAAKGASDATFNWNLAWPKAGVTFQLFKATAKGGPFVTAGSVSSVNDSAVYFQLTDPNPPSGSIYYYYLSASYPGVAAGRSDTVSVSSAPTIVTVANMPSLFQTIGNPSATSNYTVSGTDLGGDVTITPPVNFEVSGDNGVTWKTNSVPLVLSPVSGLLAVRTILVRLNALAAGDYEGAIIHTSAGAVTVNVQAKGKASNAPSINSVALLRFPFNTNASDSDPDRSAAVKPSTVSGTRLFVSNGTTVPAIPAFSTQYGIAFGATSNGDGSWGTGVGGPGGNLSRMYYQQVTVESGGSSLRLDSIIVSAAFYNTSSNTRMAVVYSLSGFALADSADITGGTGPGGSAVVGSFATPIVLANQTPGPTNTYRLALNASTGVQVPANGKLTIRFYFSCGSSSAGRYAMLKEMLVKGEANAALPLSLLDFNGQMKNNQSQLTWKTERESNMKDFEVQHSSDGNSFARVGSVPAKNMAVNQEYTFTHLSDAKGWNYYRLKMVNTDGSYKMSKTIALSTSNEPEIKVFPNPAHGILEVRSALTIRNFRVVDMNGRTMIRRAGVTAGNSLQLNISGLPGGIYQFTGITDGDPVKMKFIKL